MSLESSHAVDSTSAATVVGADSAIADALASKRRGLRLRFHVH